MKGKVFIDTNVIIYYVSNDEVKKEIAGRIILDSFDEFPPVISSQVVSEFVSVSIKRNLISEEETFALADHS
jgi:predicted nucleic acid-binding protein